jgi:uncharacterized protein YgbK (DUF1537 family)
LFQAKGCDIRIFEGRTAATVRDYKIVVFSENANGAQVAPGCLLLSRWDTETLRFALLDDGPLFFVLTQTRSLDAEAAADRIGEAARNLSQAIKETGVKPLIVSRTDCALRGHHVVETRELSRALGPFDAHLVVPELIDGNAVECGAITSADIEARAIPEHEARVVRDTLYAGRYHFLADWLSEQSSGQVRPEEIRHITLGDMRGERSPLASLQAGACAIVDADARADLGRLALDLRSATLDGRRYLMRGGASLIGALAEQNGPRSDHSRARPVRPTGPGIVMTGSRSSRTVRQIETLCAESDVQPVGIEIAALVANSQDTELKALAEISRSHAAARTAVVYFAPAGDGDEAIVNRTMENLSRRLPASVGFLILKGAPAAQHVLLEGLRIPIARVVRELMPGVTLARLPAGQTAFPGLPVVFVPGEAGGDHDLAALYRELMPAASDHRLVV